MTASSRCPICGIALKGTEEACPQCTELGATIDTPAEVAPTIETDHAAVAATVDTSNDSTSHDEVAATVELTPRTDRLDEGDGSDLHPGDTIAGKFRIVSALGSGGFGTVFRVEAPLIEREFALKVLHGGLALQDSVRRRFLQEIRLLIDLAHDHIVTLRDFGEMENGAVYYTMDLVEGSCLRTVLVETDGPVAVERAVDITRQLLLALTAAHSKCIVHRDLKPENLLITPRDGRDHLKVVDFGIARILEEVGATDHTAGGVIGTPHYMSPEQASGEPVGPASDIYSVGIILYEMLAGRRPFEGKTAREVLTKHLTTPPPTFEELPDPPNAPASLERVVLRAMAKDVEQRIPTAETFLSELHGAVDAISTQTVDRFLADKPLPIEVPPKSSHVARSFTIAALLLVASVLGFFLLDSSRSAGGTDGGHGGVVPGVAFAEMRVGDDPLQPGEAMTTGEPRLELDGRIEGLEPGEAREVRVECNGRDAGVATVGTDGSFSHGLDLDPGENSITLSIGDRRTTAVVRREPSGVTLDLGRELIDVADGRLLTGASRVVLAGTLDEWVGDTELLLVDDQGEIVVPVRGARFETTLELNADGPRELQWAWSVDDDRKLLGAFTVIRDTRAPRLTLTLPDASFVTSAGELTVRGQVDDEFRAPVYEGGAARIFIDGEEVDRVAWDGAGRIDVGVELPAGVIDRHVMLEVRVVDRAGNPANAVVNGRIDRRPPATAKPVSFDIQEDAAGRPRSLVIRGTADETLKSAEIDGKAARVTGASFESPPLSIESGERSYSIVLEDGAGNVARLSATNTVDRTPPSFLRVTFSKDGAGGTLVEVKSDEPMAPGLVAGKAAEADGLTLHGKIPTPYGDLIDESWGPTHDPITVTLRDLHGNEVEARYLVCPIDGTGILVEEGRVPTCATCSGRYCPQLKGYTPHPESRRPGVVKDRWLDGQINRFCRYCNYPRPPRKK